MKVYAFDNVADNLSTIFKIPDNFYISFVTITWSFNTWTYQHYPIIINHTCILCIQNNH